MSENEKMFKRTPRQRQLFEVEIQSSESIRRRLKKSWAEGFSQRVLPILLEVEKKFSHLYSAETGRPNWSVARMLGISILQELQDMDDQSALDCLSFDLRWQHALGLTPDQSYLSRRSLVEFRSRIVEVDPQMELVRGVFDELSDAAIDSLGISVQAQRLDSTRVVSNIFTCGRTDLFRKTLMNFMNWLEKTHPKKMKRLSRLLLKWHEESKEKGWFGVIGNLSDKKRKELLSTLADWLYQVDCVFSKDRAVLKEEPYLLVKRLLEEHCELVSSEEEKSVTKTGDGNETPTVNEEDNKVAGDKLQKVKVKKKPENPSKNLQSPYDPDAGYSGHKGPGYFAHVCETCNNDGTEIITDYDVVSAGESDRGQDTRAIDRLEQSNKKPEQLYDDGGYTTAEGYHNAKQRGVDIRSPFTNRRDEKKTFTRDKFEYDEQGFCTRCPKGYAPRACIDVHKNRSTSRNPGMPESAFFSGEICHHCRSKHKCLAVNPNEEGGSFILDIRPKMVSRDFAITEQQDKEWWEAYAIRSGIEATMSELKRRHGMGRLRVRRMPRVRLAVAMKITACNVKRWLKASSK